MRTTQLFLMKLQQESNGVHMSSLESEVEVKREGGEFYGWNGTHSFQMVCAWLQGELFLGHVVCSHNPSKWTWPVLMEVGSLPPCYLQPSCPCQVGPDRAYGEALSGQGCEDQVGVCR